MGITYKGLWHLLIERDIKKMELKAMTGISNSTLAKLGKDEYVALEVLEKICAALDCQFGDIVKYVPNQDVEDDFTQDELSAIAESVKQKGIPEDEINWDEIGR